MLQRTREIGVRMAMGAVRLDILRLVMGQGTRWVTIGVSIGLAGTVGLSFALRRLIYGLEPWAVSPVLLATVAVGLAAVVACWIPARRAARLDPNVALRAD